MCDELGGRVIRCVYLSLTKMSSDFREPEIFTMEMGHISLAFFKCLLHPWLRTRLGAPNADPLQDQPVAGGSIQWVDPSLYTPV